MNIEIKAKDDAPPNHTARAIVVIQSTLVLRGDGTEQDPKRIITQYWSRAGILLAEKDPWAGPGHDKLTDGIKELTSAFAAVNAEKNMILDNFETMKREHHEMATRLEKANARLRDAGRKPV